MHMPRTISGPVSVTQVRFERPLLLTMMLIYMKGLTERLLSPSEDYTIPFKYGFGLVHWFFNTLRRTLKRLTDESRRQA